MIKNLFYIPTLGGDGNDSHRIIAELVKTGKYEEFIAKFINGLVHQGMCQTGHERPVGETTANRIAGDLLALIDLFGGDTSSFDYQKFASLLTLDKYKKEQ